MGRRPNLVPTRPLNTFIPQDLSVKLDLLLYSEAEGRVPHGAYAAFFSARLREFFDDKALDLAPFLGTLPGQATVRGKVETIYNLMKHLQEVAK